MAHPTRDSLSDALEAALARFGGLVLDIGRRHRLSAADADEMIQEVRIRLWKAHGTSEQVAAVPASYVYRTAVSAALDLLRTRRRRRIDDAVELEDHLDLAAPSITAEQELAGSQLAREVALALRTIPATRQPVVRMHLAGYAREEIAELMGWTEAKTRNLLYRGLADLREGLAERGVTPEVVE